ncbi:Leucine-rich repeat-containing G-protein coupled receptor 4 [Holothuria leucospilota]|uniref:Leucine-rich repeat-containing G-protein coupled receptor 4 n=1 Tax=Holothuria leucospilota TaxID=206669 RepID=A0A9Q0YRJ4_HOLLE|nr:Leucine-rich repeat-containing G-protein coupled receptor 4 [Holothuria leucospilota]
MDFSWPVIHNWDYLVWYITKVFLTLICAINLTDSVPTGHNVSPKAGSPEQTCGNVCRYDEYFRRAQCNERGLTYIPSSTGCEMTTILELQNNNIQNIPPERIEEYYHVKTMGLSWNQISVLYPGTFSRLSRLRNMICSHNNLEIVPNGVFNGTEESLSRIYLNNNSIIIIGNRAFQGLAQVTFINLNDNLIKALPVRVFRDVINIKDLFLDNNELKYLNKDQFKGLKEMSTLSLQGNQIKTLPSGLFSGLESLNEVSISNNQLITILAPQILGLRLGVNVLNLTNNHMSHTAVIFPFLINATWTLYLGGNPFLCDCDFQMLQERLNTTSTQQTIDTSSENPLSCEFQDGTKQNITDSLSNLCHDTTTKEREIDNWFNRSGSTNQHGQLTSSETNPGWLPIFIFTELTLFFILWLGNTFYKPCKKAGNVIKAKIAKVQP